MDFNSWIRQQEDNVKRTWHLLKREEDEIEHEEEVVVALGQRLSQTRDRIQVSPRHHIDALMHQVAKDEARMLQSIDAVGARLAHEKTIFHQEVKRIAQSKANTPRTDKHTRQAWDYADRIWRAEEASIQERIDRVAAMGMECRRRLAASSTYSPSRRRPSTTAEPTPEEREPLRHRERTKSSADRFVRERKTSTGAVLTQPPPAAREFARERRPSQAVPVPIPVPAPSSRPVTAAARPHTAGPSRHYPTAEDSPRERERDRDRDRDREGRRERTRSEREPRDDHREHREHRDRRERTRSNAVLPTHHASHSTSHLPSSSLPAQSHMPPHPHHPHPPLPSEDRMRLAAAWTAYECRWAGLQAPIPSAPTAPLTFHNVPWPVGFQPESPRSLTPDRIKKFLLSSSHSPHRSSKERLKSALSLWRPDQWEDKWINSVEPSERDKVRYGVSVVAQCLGELLKEAAREERAGAS